jgi:hypothetical protein
MSTPVPESIVSVVAPERTAVRSAELPVTPEAPTVIIPAERFERVAALLNVMEGRLETMRDDSNFAFEQLVGEMRTKYHVLTQKLKDEKAEEVRQLKQLLSTSSGG